MTADNPEIREEPRHQDDVQDALREIQALLSRLKRAEEMIPAPEGAEGAGVEELPQQQHLGQLRRKLDELHPADVAYVLEALPLADRLLVWDLIETEQEGDILLEVSDAVRESLIETMAPSELVAAAEQLDADELADLAPDLPRAVMDDVFRALPIEEREHLREAMSYPEDSVGHLMDFELVSVREDITLEVALRYLRRYEELPDHTDQLFVVDREERLQGVLPLNVLLVNDLDVEVGALMQTETLTLKPLDKAETAAQAFDRYDLVSAPVVDEEGRLVGRVTVNEVLDYVREEAEADQLAQAGLSEEEDIFAPVLDSVKNRWRWLAINLVTAFIASRVIGAFEGSIEKLVALAALMPIVAGIGGNSGNQTITMIVRAIALGQVQPDAARRLYRKEMAVALFNGLVWGGLLGLLAFWLYKDVRLGLVMTGAMTLNLLLAATVGVAIPMTMQRLGRDPAMGASVLITAVTDSGGFFIFLGMATFFLL
ncbi:magnesium transporter [Denitratisoma oestradiolicum]|uniref:Magnesium transporter MgtE n=1 Tax=Denitratisoma oestradiolicum TaxID=311182 RepID=A0A6S6Y557_9PROT|nr:magnesium transporter [Denitratisoma oestradiolicum]TWO81057.1 magnesium transporter [Denitratisoma oestradiolicum]CAB1367728.1 Magnesium transporter MgtE [Denitratisoma oestradiolicum]